MNMKIKLRRRWYGQDGWGAFVQEIAINPDDQTLAYRISESGNCSFGAWCAWLGQVSALRFMLGPIKVTPELRAQLFVALSKLPDLKELTEQEMNSGDGEINYGGY